MYSHGFKLKISLIVIFDLIVTERWLRGQSGYSWGVANTTRPCISRAYTHIHMKYTLWELWEDKLHFSSNYHIHQITDGQVTFPLQLPHPPGYGRTCYISPPATTPTWSWKDTLHLPSSYHTHLIMEEQVTFIQFLFSCCPQGSLEFWVHSNPKIYIVHIYFDSFPSQDKNNQKKVLEVYFWTRGHFEKSKTEYNLYFWSYRDMWEVKLEVLGHAEHI